MKRCAQKQIIQFAIKIAWYYYPHIWLYSLMFHRVHDSLVNTRALPTLTSGKIARRNYHMNSYTNIGQKMVPHPAPQTADLLSLFLQNASNW